MSKPSLQPFYCCSHLNAAYPAVTQAAYGDETAVKGYVENLVKAAVKNSSVAVTINRVSYTAPIAGTSANRSGTDGSYVFTVTAAKGSQSQTTGQIKVNISATTDTSGGTSGGGSSFADVDKTDWFFDAVANVRQNGLMSGTSKTTFSPHLKVNRAMIATVLYRMTGNPHVTGENTFTDVPSGTW